MALVAYWMEGARSLAETLREIWWQFEPRLRAAISLLRHVVDVVWGLVEAHFDDPTARRTRQLLDHRVTIDRSRNPTDVFVAGADTTGLKSFGHSNLRRRTVASFDSEVKFGRSRRDGWQLAAPRVIVLGPEDEM